jgi:calnexin
LMIVDTSATKPEDWLENEPETIPDPEAEKPEEWDVSSIMHCHDIADR